MSVWWQGVTTSLLITPTPTGKKNQVWRHNYIFLCNMQWVFIVPKNKAHYVELCGAFIVWLTNLYFFFLKWFGWVCPWGMPSVPWKAAWEQPSAQSNGGILFIRVSAQPLEQTSSCYLFYQLPHLFCAPFLAASWSRSWWRQPMKICLRSSATGCWNSSPSFSSWVSPMSELKIQKKSYKKARVRFKWTGSDQMSPDRMA